MQLGVVKRHVRAVVCRFAVHGPLCRLPHVMLFHIMTPSSSCCSPDLPVPVEQRYKRPAERGEDILPPSQHPTLTQRRFFSALDSQRLIKPAFFDELRWHLPDTLLRLRVVVVLVPLRRLVLFPVRGVQLILGLVPARDSGACVVVVAPAIDVLVLRPRLSLLPRHGRRHCDCPG